MNRPTIEDAPSHEPIRPHKLSWSARYADRDWFSRSKYRHARQRKVKKLRRNTTSY